MNLRVRPRVKTVIGFELVDMKKGVIVSLIKKLLIMFLSLII